MHEEDIGGKKEERDKRKEHCALPRFLRMEKSGQVGHWEKRMRCPGGRVERKKWLLKRTTAGYTWNGHCRWEEESVMKERGFR